MAKFKKYSRKTFRYLFVPPEEGQGLVEYALILFFVAIVIIAVLSTIGPTVYDTVTKVLDYGLS